MSRFLVRRVLRENKKIIRICKSNCICCKDNGLFHGMSLRSIATSYNLSQDENSGKPRFGNLDLKKLLELKKQEKEKHREVLTEEIPFYQNDLVNIARFFGKRGKNINMLKQETRSIIYMKGRDTKDDDGGPTRVIVRADSEEVLRAAVQKVKENIQGLSEQLKDGILTEEIFLGENLQAVSRFIGVSGKNVQNLEEETGAKIHLRDSTTERDKGGKPPHVIVRADSEEVLRAAVQKVREEIQRFSEVDTTKIVPIPADAVRVFVGKKGVNINALKKMNNVTLILVDVSDEEKEVKVIGTSENVKKTVAMINQFIQAYEGGQFRREQMSMSQAAKEVAEVLTGDQQETYETLMSKEKSIERGQDEDEDLEDVDAEIPIQTLDPKVVEKFQERARGISVSLKKNKNMSPVVEDLISSALRGKLSKYEHAKPLKLPEGFRIFDGNRLNIWSKEDFLNPEPEIPKGSLWYQLQKEKEEKMKNMFIPSNRFEELIKLTNEGKIWKYPIDNEQGISEEEQDVSFVDHVFLDDLVEDFPKIGPIRQFIDLVIVGLSNNPYLTVQEKRDHIEWYRKYFKAKAVALQDVFGESGLFSEVSKSHQ